MFMFWKSEVPELQYFHSDFTYPPQYLTTEMMMMVQTSYCTDSMRAVMKIVLIDGKTIWLNCLDAIKAFFLLSFISFYMHRSSFNNAQLSFIIWGKDFKGGSHKNESDEKDCNLKD